VRISARPGYRALKSLVLVGQQQLIAGVEKVAAVTRLIFECVM
jgi:hypothetical protein